MAIFSYRTITTPAEGQYKEKGSRFLSFAFPVEREADIKGYLVGLEKEYFDARHHCYAWILGPEGTNFRAHDAGEPNHSAGDPILGQIRSRQLTNALVVVVRYFGGTKLGVGGLVAAYKAAAAEALNRATIVEKELTKDYTLLYDYVSTPEVMRLIKEFALTIADQSFQETCSLNVQCNMRTADALKEKLELLKALGHLRSFSES